MRRALFPMVICLAACKQDSGLNEPTFLEPSLELRNPGRAAWTSAGTVAFDGHAENLTNVSVATIATTPDSAGDFGGETTMERGINLIEASGTDMNGDLRYVRNGVLAGDFGDPTERIENAARVRVNQGGLDVISAKAAEMLTADALRPMITGFNPVYEYHYDLWGFEAVNAYADVTWIDFGSPSLELSPRTGVLDTGVQLPNLAVDVTVYGDIVGIDFETYVTAIAEKARATGKMTVSASHGDLQVGFTDGLVYLDGFFFDLSLIPSEIEGDLLSSTVQGFLEDKLSAILTEQVPALIEAQLSQLDLSFNTVLMERDVAIHGSFASAGVDNSGIVADIDLDVNLPDETDLPYEGYLLADAGEPDSSVQSDLAVSLSDDLLNRVLFEAWQSSLIDMRMSTDDGSLSPIMLLPLHATEGTITLHGNLPPVAVESAGQLQAQIGELDLVIDTPGGELGEHLEASVTAYVPLEITITDGVLKLALGSPKFNVTVRNSDWGASNEATTQLLEEMLPIDTLLTLLGDFEFPIPELVGITVGSAEVERSGGVYSDITVDLR